jgi:spermidine synthase
MKFTHTELNGTLKFEFEINEILEDFNSPFQRIRILNTAYFGNILVLDDEIQLCSLDEFIYHEMFCFPPLLIHPNPSNVLIIGGGDLLLAKQVLKYPKISSIDLVEIDEMVIDASRKHFADLLEDLDTSRLHIIIEDGLKFVRRCETTYDLIYIDLTTEKEIAAPLYSQKFYNNLKSKLNAGGIIAAQTGANAYFQYSETTRKLKPLTTLLNNSFPVYFLRLFKNCNFKYVWQYSQFIPTFYALWSFTMGSETHNFKEVSPEAIKERYGHLTEETLFYSPSYHQTLFLPPKLLQNLFFKARL